MRKNIVLGALIAATMGGCASQRERTLSSRSERSDFLSPNQVSTIAGPTGSNERADSSQLTQEATVRAASFKAAVSPSTSYSLEDFENLSLSNNPTIAELVATTQKAAGFRTQVGLRANPTMGYNGTQIADAGTDQHTFFISQTIITADKRELNRRVLNETLRAQLFQLEAQKYRVITDVRVKFFDALAAQKRVELVREFQSVVTKGVELAELREQASEGSRLEVVQAKQQLAEAELALEQAEAAYIASWRELSALAGCADLEPSVLVGELPSTAEVQDWAALAESTILESPEYQVARARLSQSQANLQRQNVQAVPNLDVNIASGVDNGTNSGLINIQVGAPIPVFNKNQGNIAAARAELSRASREIERIEKSVNARLAAVSRDYNLSLAAVEKYQSRILPNAKQGLELAEIAYKGGETSFIQVLIARRSFFDTNLQYVAAQALLAQSQSRIDGYVLSGGLDPIIDDSGDDSLRGLTFSQQ
jgi:cobalt-zinc-cadmium efflux system outer membrane protein